MATTPPFNAAGESVPVAPTQIKEDPDSLALRQKLIDQETRHADNVAAMNATQKLLVQALLTPPAVQPVAPVSDAELWRGFAGDVLRAGAIPGVTVSEWCADVADKMLAAYRKRYPLPPTP